jgi:hypothetical protein
VRHNNAGNLFVDGLKNGNTPVLEELANGSKSFKEPRFKKRFRNLSQIQWDGISVPFGYEGHPIRRAQALAVTKPVLRS